jgi:ribA/ribD-fused uncharacterized protein
MSDSAYQRQATTDDKRELLLFHTGRSIFSNFHPAPFTIDGKRYLHVEQYYQSMKAQTFGDCETQLAILRAYSPKQCKALGYAIRNFDMAKWKEVSESVMQKGVLEKFLQNPTLRQALLNTGKAEIIEATKYDRWWGSGCSIEEDHQTYPGFNKLGLILSDTRACLSGCN